MAAGVSSRTASTLPVAELKLAFSFLEEEEQAQLAGFLDVGEWPAGSVVMEDGAPAEYILFLTAGKLAVKKGTNFPGKHILIAIIEPGSMVGELALATGGDRSAMVEAMENCHGLILSRESLDRLFVEFPAIGCKLFKQVIHILGLRLGKAYDRLAWVL